MVKRDTPKEVWLTDRKEFYAKYKRVDQNAKKR